MDSHEYVKKLMEPQTLFPDLENKENQKERITIDNVEDSDALQIFARVTAKGNVHYKIYIDTWLKSYLRKYPDDRDHCIEQFVNALNGAIDEDA